MASLVCKWAADRKAAGVPCQMRFATAEVSLLPTSRLESLILLSLIVIMFCFVCIGIV
jgi:hypothetical protein